MSKQKIRKLDAVKVFGHFYYPSCGGVSQLNWFLVSLPSHWAFLFYFWKEALILDNPNKVKNWLALIDVKVFRCLARKYKTGKLSLKEFTWLALKLKMDM